MIWRPCPQLALHRPNHRRLATDGTANDAALAREALARGQAEATAGNAAEARRWLERACRLAPGDQTPVLVLATTCLGQDDARAVALFQRLSAESDVREAWLGLAVAHQRLGNPADAALALAV